jgi:hypothetical protein
MKKWSKLIVLAVVVFGLINLALGVTFITIGADKQHWIRSAMEQEGITLGIPDSQIAAGEIIDTMGEAQAAGDIVRGHRHQIAPTYGDLLGNEHYDPTDPTQLTYAQAMNIENYLYLAANSYGVTYLSMGVGVALLLGGIALVAIAVVLYFWRRRLYETEISPATVATE